MRQVVILHGWSDSSRSFRGLTRFLTAHGYRTVPLWLGDYLSLEDDVRVEDVGRRMQAVVSERLRRGELAAPFDLIVHSTGGLIAREWISAHYSGEIGACPARRLIMLAPANFGSRLAALGQSMLGRVVKGWNNWFRTGREMLRALELASPYQWQLAERDLFVPRGAAAAAAIYGETGVRPFVITGSHPYPQRLRQIVNEDGADGTVRVAAANLNARGLTIDFAADEFAPALRPWRLRHEDPFPLAVLPDRTHGSIIAPDAPDVRTPPGHADRLGDLILAALACETRDAYRRIAEEWDAVSERTAALGATAETFHQYLQVNVRVIDDRGAAVGDYFLEFSGPEAERGDASSVYFHREVLEHVHVNGIDPSRRCLYVDRTDLIENYYGRIRGEVERVLALSISASPPGDNVGYFSDVRRGAGGTVVVHRAEPTAAEPRWLRRNTTHFVEIVIPRSPADKVFRLARARD
jgi:pimeloyl-ACP methyl ester carboxylesterase